MIVRTARYAAVPPGADDACVIAHALLFTGDNSVRVSIGRGEMPLDLHVAQDDAAIDTALLQSWVMRFHDYLAGDLPHL